MGNQYGNFVQQLQEKVPPLQTESNSLSTCWLELHILQNKCVEDGQIVLARNSLSQTACGDLTISLFADMKKKRVRQCLPEQDPYGLFTHLNAVTRPGLSRQWAGRDARCSVYIVSLRKSSMLSLLKNSLNNYSKRSWKYAIIMLFWRWKKH